MIRPSRIGALAAGLVTMGLVASTAPVSPVSAAMMTQHFALHGSGQFANAMAAATVTEVGKGDFRLQITAEHLPNPAMLHIKPQRKVYLAWAIDGKHKNSAMGVLPLKLDSKTGNYTANNVVMIQEITQIAVTADQAAKQHMPTMPEVTVLTSGHGTGM
jgi:hypothetical protein